MRRTFLLFALAGLCSYNLQAQSYPEVWFDNSSLAQRYAESSTHYQGDSWIKNFRHQLPVSQTHFFTPGNALELNYTSAEIGEWQANLNYASRRGYRLAANEVFSFKTLILSDTQPQELPALMFQLADSTWSDTVQLADYIKNIEGSDWVSVEIPAGVIAEIDSGTRLKAIRFFQNSAEGKEHRLFIDQIELLPKKTPRSPLTSAAVLASATGFERHVDLTWTLPFTPSIRYVKIYRSTDNQNFLPVGIRPIFVKKYSDIVPDRDQTYYYRVAWVDYAYRESPLSNVLEAKTKRLSDSELLDMVRKSSISLITDGEEFNSGMQLLNIYSKQPIISLKSTGAGLLALISELREDAQARENAFKRVEKMVAFLESADQQFGVFPELLNGRTGKSVFGNPDSQEPGYLMVDLEATAMMMQGLLVAQRFFDQKGEEERQLSKRIDALWQAVEWDAFVRPGEPYLLSHWSSAGELSTAEPLSGLSKRYIYLMALASPRHAISWDDYQLVVHQPLEASRQEGALPLPLLQNPSQSVRPAEKGNGNFIDGTHYTKVPYINGNTYYGIKLESGNPQTPLQEVLLGFMALNPKSIRGAQQSYDQVIRDLIHIQHRQRMEEDVPLASSSLELSSGIAVYPFDRELAMDNIKRYYLQYAESLWTEYGFIGAIDFEENKIARPNHELENALAVVMINNGESGLIWDLFTQSPAIKGVLASMVKD